MMQIDRVTMRRLLYVKRLLMHAQEHMSDIAEFDRMVAVLHFDNAIELLLKCVAASYDISFQWVHVSFHELWSKVDKAYEEKHRTKLPRKTEIFHLHGIRSDVQHWGTPFSLEMVREYNECTQDFVEKILNSVFGLKYEELFLSSFIEDEKLRTLLTDAEKYFAGEKWKEAISKLSIAFALAEREARKRKYSVRLPRTLSSGDIDERTGILALGLDVEEYVKFMDNTPVVILVGEEPVIQWKWEFDFSKENTFFCLNFALDSILRWRL